MLGVQRRAVEAACSRRPSARRRRRGSCGPSCARSMPARRTCEPQPVAGALDAGDRADRVQLARRPAAPAGRRARRAVDAGPALDLRPRRRRRPGPDLQAVGVGRVVVALPGRRRAQVAAAPARAVGAGGDPDRDLVDPARGQRELARGDRQRELDDVVPGVEVQRRAPAPALDAQRHEEVRAARHPHVDLGLAPVPPGVEHVQVPVVVGELEIGGPGGHVRKCRPPDAAG